MLSLGEAHRIDQTLITALAEHLTAEQSFGETASGDRQIDAALHQRLGHDLAVGLAKNQS
ncbi:hypothetical protein D3C87_1726060 [compost metagenome]